MDYFEPFINKLDPLQDFDFLENWSVFIQKLSNIFGSYTSENNNKNTIIAILFPYNKKAMTYLIQFAKYQNRIRWKDHSLQKVVKDIILERISEELYFSKKDISTFKDLKRAVLKINSDYWRRVNNNRQRYQVAKSTQGHSPKNPKFKALSTSSIPNRILSSTSNSLDYTQISFSFLGTSQLYNLLQILDPDGKLIPVECQCRMDLGLCLYYSNFVMRAPKRKQFPMHSNTSSKISSHTMGLRNK